MTVEAARELRGDERLELLVPGAPCEPARDEEGLVAGGDAEALQLGDGGGDRRLARIALGAGQRQLRRLDDDRRTDPARDERLERLARQPGTPRGARPPAR